MPMFPTYLKEKPEIYWNNTSFILIWMQFSYWVWCANENSNPEIWFESFPPVIGIEHQFEEI